MLRSRRTELFFLVVLFVFSLAIRWYHLSDNLFFGFEQGRDATIVQNIYLHHDFKLVGPQTDVPGIFHGAYYFYVMLLPWILSGGNPLALSFFLVVLSSTVPVIAYFFAKDVFKKQPWPMLTAILVAVSYECILYARWLSNVTPAIPLIFLAYYFLWKYRERKKFVFFLMAAVVAVLAMQFEIILVLCFGFALLFLFIFKIVPLPSAKNLLLTVVTSAIFFLPHLLFNFRNNNIMVNAVFHFAGDNKSAQPFSLLTNLLDFGSTYLRIFRQTLSLPPGYSYVYLCVIALLLIGLCINFKKRKEIVFFGAWAVSPLPIIFFQNVPNLLQLYIGIGGAIIFLCVFAVQAFWKLKVGRAALGVMSLILIWGYVTMFLNLTQNRDVFFITIQEGMNYKDQRQLLADMNQDAQGQTIRFTAFTIPYWHPEGWKYLQQYFYPQQKTDDGAKTVYIAIEKQVEPYWEQTWIKDLGPSQLVSEKTFGVLRLQKRQLIDKPKP